MIILEGTRGEIYQLIADSPDAETAYLKTKPSKLLIAYLLNKTKISKIICSNGIYKTFTKKMKNALEKMGIEIEVLEKKAGRPRKHGEEIIEKAKALLRKGMTKKRAAKELGISERNLYYRLKNESR